MEQGENYALNGEITLEISLVWKRERLVGAIEEKKKIMKELRKNVKERDGENYALNGEL